MDELTAEALLRHGVEVHLIDSILQRFFSFSRTKVFFVDCVKDLSQHGTGVLARCAQSLYVLTFVKLAAGVQVF